MKEVSYYNLSLSLHVHAGIHITKKGSPVYQASNSIALSCLGL